MKTFVVAILSFYNNEIKQFKVEANDEFDAAKEAILLFLPEYADTELEFQQTDSYPKDLSSLIDYLHGGDMTISVIEI